MAGRVTAVLALTLLLVTRARAASDCLVGWQVGGRAAPAGAMRLACHAGDPACDADGVADGGCTFSVGLCVNPPTPSRCTPGTVARVDVRGTDAAALAPAIA